MSAEEPKVFRATYSSTEVFECILNENPIMRRCKDNWVNATQILKCCNFPKAKRTKILEKGVQIGLHEKVQGGFGKFQGTWIPLEDAQKLAVDYGVTAEMAPVLYLDVSNPNSIPAKVKAPAKDPTPTKRKYNKKPVKRVDETPTKKYKAEQQYSNPPYMSFSHQVPPPFQQQPEMMNQDYYLQMQRMNQMNQMNQNQQMGQMGQMNQNQQMGQMNQMEMNQQNQMGVNQQMSNHMLLQQQLQQQQLHQQQLIQLQHQSKYQYFNKPSSQSTNETNWSQDDISRNPVSRESDTSMSSLEDQPYQQHYSPKEKKETYAQQLLRFFSEDNAEIPYFVHEMPYDFDINEPIDDEGHTPLHWAASIGNYQMIHLLLSKGSSPLVVNNFGLNPLSKLISFNNCYELKNFPKVLNDLELSLINTDINGRTPLHYLCQFSKVQSKYESLRYYLEVILDKLKTTSRNSKPPVDLLRNVLDHQDINGDTCMHLAIKAGCSKIVKLLLENGARDDLENIHKQTAKQLIVHYNLLTDYSSMPQDSLIDQSDISYEQIPSQKRFAGEYQVLETPVQPFNTAETPDTQRTTIQSDGVEEEEVPQSTFVKAEENKENIFMNKELSTPTKNASSQSEYQPLAAITERTVESTPIMDKKKPKQSLNGTLVLDGSTVGKLPMDDLASMVSGLIGTLSTAYTSELAQLTEDVEKIQKEIEERKESNSKLDHGLSKSLSLFFNAEISSLSDGKQLLEAQIQAQEEDIKTSSQKLLQQITSTKDKELLEEIAGADGDSSDDKLTQAIELTNLVVERKKLMERLVDGMVNYGIDDRMYKYRKLISLSCGLKVEDIDSLIDGIEESLQEA